MSSGIYRVPFPTNEPILNYAAESSERSELKTTLKTYNSSAITLPLVIGGEHIQTKDRLSHQCPHEHSRTVAHCAVAGETEINRAIATACHSQKTWGAMPWQDRAAVFLKAADLLAGKYRSHINATTINAQSKTVYQAEIDAACELIDFLRFNAYYLERLCAEQPLYSPKGQWNRSECRGLEGFVFAVGPFNFTSISVNLATAPALMGCGVVWKPSLQAQPASYVALQCLEEAGLPPGVINLVQGDAALIGSLCLAHPQLAGVHFTGSTNTFNHLWQTVGSHIGRYKSYPRIVGETGGKDFVFAHPSADRQALVTALIRGAFEYQGQKCSAASRAYIPQSVWRDIKDQLITTTEAISMGSPEDFRHFMGAVIDRRAFDKIKGYLDRARRSADTKILAGGHCDDGTGYFIRPTILESSNPHSETMVQEIFGPVLTVFVFKDEDYEDAIRLCDTSTPYALTGAIFARDRHAIVELSAKLSQAAGNLYINDKPTGAVVGQQPFGGARASGTNDKAGSPYNLLRWTSHRTIKENLNPPTDIHYPHMTTP
jgi:1-pyrroline-5-carboxylate dehydrogenase